MNLNALILGTQKLSLQQQEEKDLNRICYLYFWSGVVIQILIAASTAFGLFWFL